jgi:hypothetical protein
VHANAQIHAAVVGDPGIALRHSLCNAIPHCTAPTTEPNSINAPSPVVLRVRPPCSAISGSAAARCSRNACAVPASSSPISRL